MAERTSRGGWLWPVLLLSPMLVGWFWWKHQEPEMAERSSWRSPPVPTTSTVSHEPKVGGKPALPPPRSAPKKGHSTLLPMKGSSSTATAVRRIDLSDAAIAALEPDTIAMLNRHRYWTPNGFVDRLYDVWRDQKTRGIENGEVRWQIAMALQGQFVDEY